MKFWTAEEDAVLQQLWPHQTPTRIAEAVGRSALAVHARATRLKLKPHYQHNYTPKEDEVIIDCWQVMNAKEIQTLLPHRSEWSIKQ